MQPLTKISTEGCTWIGVLAVALTIAADMLARANSSPSETISLIQRLLSRRANPTFHLYTR
jgi:hypothetical protein